MVRTIAEFIERQAGHILVSIGLILTGLVAVYLKMERGNEIVAFALGVLATILKPQTFTEGTQVQITEQTKGDTSVDTK